jgi:5-methyltetrahydropteroyltriglutamate--homocysteine methyltransferase
VSEKLFPTQEIGSLMKPSWLVKGLRGQAPAADDLSQLSGWSKALKFTKEAKRVEELLKAPSGQRRDMELRDLASIHQVRYLEAAGLDYVFDGEVHRMEMYEHPIRNSKGFTFYGHVRSFDNKYYLKAAATSRVGFLKPYHLEEYEFIAAHAKKTVKVPITGPYTLADWSFNEYYLKKAQKGKGRLSIKDRISEARRELTLDIATEVIRPNLKALIKAGAPVIQIDEPAATTKPDEAELFVEAFNEATKGLDAKFPVHICFSDYALLFPQVLEMKRCSQWQWEFANKEASGDGYRYLDLLNEYGDRRQVGLGVLDIHVDKVESPQTVRDRVLRAAEVLDDPSRILVNPDCGLRTRSLDVAYQKLSNMVKGTEMAREVLA